MVPVKEGIIARYAIVLLSAAIFASGQVRICVMGNRDEVSVTDSRRLYVHMPENQTNGRSVTELFEVDDDDSVFVVLRKKGEGAYISEVGHGSTLHAQRRICRCRSLGAERGLTSKPLIKRPRYFSQFCQALCLLVDRYQVIRSSLTEEFYLKRSVELILYVQKDSLPCSSFFGP